MPVCGSCGEDNPPTFRFCPACGAPLEAEPARVREERRVVTALFTDIVGSTATAENLDPEDVRARLAPYYARVRRELERCGGTVEKFIGDAVVALFGAPVAHEDDPERAVRAAFAIRDAVAELNAAEAWLDLHIRTGVNTGEALVVLGAAVDEGEGMAAGDVMNTAARIQAAAPVDGVLVSEATLRATADAIQYREAEPLQAKGKAAPVPVWEAVAVRPPAARRQRSSTPLVGRERDLEELAAVWACVRAEERPALGLLLGPAGIGKSRLLLEFEERVRGEARVHWGRCLSYGEGITYWPVIEIVKDAAGIHHDDDAAAAAAKLGALIESLGTSDADELRTIASALANLVGAPTTPRGMYATVEMTQAELHWGVRQLLRLLAARHPLVLVFEDLHWAEPTLLDLLAYLIEGDAARPLLILGSARPELADLAPALLAAARGDGVVLELAALSEDESARLLCDLMGAEGAHEERVRELVQHAGGNPLFLEETVRMLRDAGEAAAHALPVPTSLHSLIAARLDRLPAREKALAQTASVVGRVFWTGAVARLDGASGDVRAGLEGLARRDVVRAHDGSTVAGEPEWAFTHALIREVAYGQLPKGRRAGLHVRFADWLATLPGAADELVEFLAYHLEQACRLAREVARSPVPPPVLAAVDALTRAAEKAERREGIREAAGFYSRALDLVDESEGATRAELRLRRARMLVALGELRQACEELNGVADAAVAVARPDVRGAALVALANVDQKQGRPAEGRSRLAEAESIAVAVGDPCLQIRAVFESSALRSWFDGATESPVEDLRRGIRLAEEVDDRALRVEGHLRMGFLLFNMGELRTADEQLERCISLAQDAGSHRDEARATFLLGLVRYYRGGFEEAERLGLQAAEWLERTADTYMQVQNLVRALAVYALARGEPELAERRLRDALLLALDGGGWVVMEIYRYLTEALVRQGRLTDARELAAFARRSMPAEDRYACACVLLVEATAAAADGDRAEASASFEEAIRLLEEQRMLVELADAHVAFARALRRLGDEGRADEELERARRAFARIGAAAILVDIEREAPAGAAARAAPA
jgi:class 3 adenylate cyclase/tetratricopeptide (TPR) repeat protein